MGIQKLKNRLYAVLRWTEQYTKTDMVYIAHGGFWLWVGQGVTLATGFVLTIAFGRLVSPTVYGSYQYLRSLADVLAICTLSGLGVAMIPSVANGTPGILHASFWTHLRWSAWITICAWASAFFFWYHGNTPFAIGLFFVGAIRPFSRSWLLYTTYLHGRRDFKRKSIFETSTTVLRSIALIVALFFIHDPAGLIIVYVVATALLSAYFFYKTCKQYEPIATPCDVPVDYAKHLSLLNIFNMVADQVDSIFIFHYIGPAELATYSFAILIPEQIRNTLKKINTLALPKFVDKTFTQIHSIVFSEMRILGALYASLTLIYIVLAPSFFHLFLPKYIDAISLSQISALTFITISNLSMQALVAKKAIKEKYITDITSSILRILLSAMVVVPFGIWGVLIVRVVIKYIDNIMTLFFITRRARSERRHHPLS